MRTGTQFTGTVAAGQSVLWYTFNWPQAWQVAWYVVPTSPDGSNPQNPGAQPLAPQIEWKVQVERASADFITYWISVHNLSSQPVNVEARYAVFN